MNETNELQKMIYEAKIYSEQIRLLQTELERISMTMMELNSSLKVVEWLKENLVFVPIGGGAMISANVTSNEVLLPIGGGYLIAFKKDEALEEIKKRIRSTETAIERLNTELEKIDVKFNETSRKIETMRNPQKNQKEPRE